MIGTISRTGADANNPALKRAEEKFTILMTHVANLYCMGGSSSLSAYEAQELAMSVAYTLGIMDTTPEKVACVLDVEDPIALWQNGVTALDNHIDGALCQWNEIVATMPPIRNVSLRDTLVSLGELRSKYDTRFAAHEVPCDIDYQLSNPIKAYLLGIDYIEAWLAQLLEETRWIAQFDARSCEQVLERVCPDYRGLHINLYDLLFPHANELVKRA